LARFTVTAMATVVEPPPGVVKRASGRSAGGRPLPPALRATLAASRPMFGRAVRRTLDGRYWDSDDPSRGRIMRADVKRILARTWREFDVLIPGARLEGLPNRGSRQNVMLGVLSLALHRALLAEGIERRYAAALFTDAAWQVYRSWIRLPRALARMVSRDDARRMELMLRMFLRYPFARPGYEWRARREPDAFEIDFTRCPVQEYMRAQGESDFMLNSWCTLDFALAQAMVPGGRYERRHTLSAGDPVCDMRWQAAPRS